jgi:hypothetical protein
MTSHRLPYDDAATPAEMVSDAAQVGRELHIPLQQDVLGADEPATPAFGSAGPVEVSDELARLAAGLELHFD